MEARALQAVLVDLIRQDFTTGVGKAELGKEIGNAGEEADARDLVVPGFVEQSFDQSSSRAFALVLWRDRDRTNFRQVTSVEMQRAAGDDLAIVFDDGEVADV